MPDAALCQPYILARVLSSKRSATSAALDVAMPAMPIPMMNRPTRISSSVGRNKPERPANVNTASEAIKVRALPMQSATIPTNRPQIATASEGRVMISETVVSDESGKAWLMAGSAGATAAPPMTLSMDTSTSVTIAPLAEDRSDVRDWPMESFRSKLARIHHYSSALHLKMFWGR